MSIESAKKPRYLLGFNDGVCERKVEFLHGYLDARARVKDLDQDIARMRSELTSLKSVDYSRDHVQVDMYDRDLSGKVAKIETKMKERDEAACQSLQQLRTLRAIIAAIPDRKIALIFTFRYVSGSRWDEIGKKVGHTANHLRELHKKGLQFVQLPKSLEDENIQFDT